MMMDIRLVDDAPSQAAAWDDFVERHPGATSDHLWGWRQVLPAAFGYEPHYLSAWENSRLVGILPLFRIPRGWGRWALSSIPFGNYGGICADTPAAAAALLAEATALMNRTGCRYLELRHREPLDAAGRLRPQSLYHRFTVPLCGDPAGHWDALGGNNRRKISSAKRRGLCVAVSRDVDALYRIHTHTMRRLGTPCFPRAYFAEILRRFPERSRIHFAQHRGQTVAYDLVLFFKSSMVIQLGGALTAHQRYYVNSLLFWYCVEEGCARGLAELDFCRNRADSGSARYKRQLRMQERPLAYQYVLPLRQTLPSRHPSNRKYQPIIAVWKRLPLPLTRMLGPALVRYLA